MAGAYDRLPGERPTAVSAPAPVATPRPVAPAPVATPRPVAPAPTPISMTDSANAARQAAQAAELKAAADAAVASAAKQAAATPATSPAPVTYTDTSSLAAILSTQTPAAATASSTKAPVTAPISMTDSANTAREAAKAAAGATPTAPVDDPFYLGTGTTKTVVIDGKSYTGIDVGSTKPPAAGGIGSISPASGQTITGLDRNPVKEAEALRLGYTKEYLASRGGINAQGYYNDIPLSGQLTAEEQKQVTLPNGTTNTAEMARILQEKQIKEKIASGMSEAEATAKVSQQYGQYGITSLGGSATGTPGALDANGNPVPTTPTTSTTSTTTGATGSDKILAKETFKNTLALFFGPNEVAQPWVDSLYNVVQGYYNTGSTVDEAINLSVQNARNTPALKPFADRFSGVYALQDKLTQGMAVTVPTVAEYFRSQEAMGEVLRQAGMGELATQKFLGDTLGLGKSVSEITNLINDTFYSIDNAPAALKKDLEGIMALGVSRTDIAKALLTGKEGAAELNKKVAQISSFSAAKSQGVNVDMTTAADVAARGYDYNKSLAGFADVKRLERGQQLGRMSSINFNQQEAIDATFGQDVAAQNKIAKIGEEEVNRFSGRIGRLNSQSRAAGLI